MEKINVVLMRPIERELIDQISSVNSAINILDASSYFSLQQPGEENAKSKNELDKVLAQADVILGFWPPEKVLSRSPHLKWFHSMLAGVDRPEFKNIVNSSVLLTNTTGIHGTQMSELVFELMLMLAKRATFCFSMQKEKKWAPFFPGLLNGKTLGIVGLGSIGKDVAHLGKAFGMRVIASRRSIKQITQDTNVDILMPSADLIQLLSESDYVVLIVPATPETRNLIGERELRSMKPDAYLINIARGSVIDEKVLIRALKEKWIAGAGLDTVTVEPLAPSSELWDLPNVLITPHIGGRRDDYNYLAIPVFCENMKRFINGEELMGIVSKDRGY